MPDLKQLTRQKPTTATIDLGDGDKVELVFDRNGVTPAWSTFAQEQGRKDPMALATALSQVILQWDVTDDGAPFPPTPEHLGVLSYDAQRNLLAEIVSAAVPTDAEGNASPATQPSASSDFALAPMSSPNGTGTSTSLEPSASPSPT